MKSYILAIAIHTTLAIIFPTITAVFMVTAGIHAALLLADHESSK